MEKTSAALDLIGQDHLKYRDNKEILQILHNQDPQGKSQVHA